METIITAIIIIIFAILQLPRSSMTFSLSKVQGLQSHLWLFLSSSSVFLSSKQLISRSLAIYINKCFSTRQ